MMRKKDKEFAAALASCVNTTPVLMREEYNYPYLDPMPKRKPPTNADCIRSMSDEELAEFIAECERAGYADGSITPKGNDGYHMDVIDWLRQPAEATP